jgi:catechol 2,3-dioxygenase-like lactoylglutathione lyase family enzyme
MLNYVTIGANDTEASWRFYDAALGALGWTKAMDFPGWRGYSPDGSMGGQMVWVCKPFNGEAARAGNGMMVGFGAKNHEEVEAFYTAAMASGGADEGAPGPRPQYGPNWYSAYVRDPAGNKLSIVFNG